MIKKPNEVFLGEAIRGMIEFYNLEEKLQEVRIISAWENVVGTMIARHTTSLYIRRRKLHVVLDSSVVRNELSFARSKILKLLNKEAGSKVIDEVVLQ